MRAKGVTWLIGAKLERGGKLVLAGRNKHSSHTNNVYPPERPLPCTQHQPNIIPHSEAVKYQDYTSMVG
jgi:hypothetical protein